MKASCSETQFTIEKISNSKGNRTTAKSAGQHLIYCATRAVFSEHQPTSNTNFPLNP